MSNAEKILNDIQRNRETNQANAQMIANARLIAAAPKLLEACKEALKFFVCLDIQQKTISGLGLMLNEAVNEAEAKQG